MTLKNILSSGLSSGHLPFLICLWHPSGWYRNCSQWTKISYITIVLYIAKAETLTISLSEGDEFFFSMRQVFTFKFPYLEIQVGHLFPSSNSVMVQVESQLATFCELYRNLSFVSPSQSAICISAVLVTTVVSQI